ncbi:hypothetical protein ABZZ79_31155 [Streptomyces sp. NPDC006458]|uniref:hypothetical protein n=1 Tax=Streptomyces sp. NPDC006458 TaxID=3154302 RepID=UPI0033B0B88E
MTTGGRAEAAPPAVDAPSARRHPQAPEDPELDEMIRRFVAARRRANLRRAAERSLRLRLLGLEPQPPER